VLATLLVIAYRYDRRTHARDNDLPPTSRNGILLRGDVSYGKRLLPHIVDGVASQSPDRIVYSIVNDPDDANVIKQITADTFAKAIDKTAWWLRSLVGARSSVLPVGYIGPRK
jgi:hypothetical protein